MAGGVVRERAGTVTERASAATVYERGDIVAHYAAASGLYPVEAELFDRHVSAGARVLDLGVGAGRTTPWLSARASTYVGLDLSEGMVAWCSEHFRSAHFVQGDATELAQFDDSTFDVVVFSFNGIDCIPTEVGRQRCLSQCRRVLAPGGRLIFSSHNARYWVFPPRLEGGLARRAWRTLYAALHTLSNLVFLTTRRAFWAGRGFVRDPATHGGLKHIATVASVREELDRAGFEVLEVLSDLHPRRLPSFATAWYYYASRKLDRA